MYYKALMANAATSALRLHQRLPRVQFTREFLAMLFVEDSAHYLLYSFNFIYSGPMTREFHFLPDSSPVNRLFHFLFSKSYLIHELQVAVVCVVC